MRIPSAASTSNSPSLNHFSSTPTSSIIYLFLLSSLQYLNFKLTVLSSLTVLFSGILVSLISCIKLWLKLGICPDFYHSTSCQPHLKQDKISFKSTKVLETGILNGIIDSLFWLIYTNLKNETFVAGFVIYIVLAMFWHREKYYLTDVLAILLGIASVLNWISFGFNEDFVWQGLVWIIFAKGFLMKVRVLGC